MKVINASCAPGETSARSCVAVKKLPKGALCEIEAVAVTE